MRLGDLGVAKELNTTVAETLKHTVVGTPYYLSPELCEGKAYNYKTDVWSLGCVLYEMLTKKHPFEANNPAGLVLKIVGGKFSPVPVDYSKEIAEIVTKCLNKDQKKRPSFGDIFKLEAVRTKARALNIKLPNESDGPLEDIALENIPEASSP